MIKSIRGYVALISKRRYIMGKRHAIRNILLISAAALIVAVPLYILISGYMENRPKLRYTFSQKTQQYMTSYPDTKFAVMSDLHYYDTSLGTTGSAFEECLKSDRKLLKDSADLLDLAVEDILKSGVEFVLISGDLTKDGERDCHQKVAEKLSKLTEHGIKVYVIPGNHDVNNPGAYRYEGSESIPVPNITAAQFADIYSGCGYKSAIYRDTNSLSYVAELAGNLWLVAVDSCRSRENKPGEEEIVGGKLSQQQEKWLEDILTKANLNKKAVIFMEHHGVVEHWKGQSRLHPEYLIEDYKYIARLLASFDVRLAFTGHYHAQDISMSDFAGGGFIYDIETGSLITPPCAVRYCTIKNNRIYITSDSLTGKLHPGTDFAENAQQFVSSSVNRKAFETLKKYFVPDKDAHYMSDYISSAFIAHYNGDENAAGKPAFEENKLGLWSRIVYFMEKYAAKGLWEDTPPADNNTTLELGS